MLRKYIQLIHISKHIKKSRFQLLSYSGWKERVKEGKGKDTCWRVFEFRIRTGENGIMFNEKNVEAKIF
jgi:hypothetical protein